MATNTEGLKKLQDGAEEVRAIMLDNYQSVNEREEKLEDLDKRADALLAQSKQFHRKSKKVKVKMEKENTSLQCGRWKLIAIAVGVGVVALVIIIIATAWPQ